jgi:type IV pilus assembly protein PilE
MQFQRATIGCPACRILSSGFSLVEMMVVMVVIGILVAMAVPTYQRAVEQSHADIAAANLRAIWAAERLYWLEYHAYTSSLTDLRDIGLLDSQVVLSANGYTYAIASAESNSFEATATRTGSTQWSGQYTIDQTGVISGTLYGAGGTEITAGFQ